MDGDCLYNGGDCKSSVMLVSLQSCRGGKLSVTPLSVFCSVWSNLFFISICCSFIQLLTAKLLDQSIGELDESKQACLRNIRPELIASNKDPASLSPDNCLSWKKANEIEISCS